MKNNNKPNIFVRIGKKIAGSKLVQTISSAIHRVLDVVGKSIRFELIATCGVCFLVSSFIYTFSVEALSDYVYTSNIEYDYESINYNAQDLVRELAFIDEAIKEQISDGSIASNMSEEDYKKIYQQEVIKILNENTSSSSRIYVTDLDGKIIYSFRGEASEKVDIYNVLEKMNTPLDEEKMGDEVTYLYPVTLNGERNYLLYTDRPQPTISEDGYYNENRFGALIIATITFVAIFIIVTNRKMKYIEEISGGLEIISKGDLSYRIDVRGKDEIANLANNINYMAMEINDKIQAERRAEHTKAELITNVSHDLRTPLTSVMGYLGLVKENKYEDDKQMKDYLNIAFNKAERLKLLIDDLFEYTKLNNNGIKLEKSRVNLNEFLSQLIEEYIPMFEDNQMHVHKTLKATNSLVEIDSSKMVRVLENLLSNAIKYSYKPGVVMIESYNQDGNIIVTVKNRGEVIPQEKVERLFERFYRVDEARNSEVSGTGLGLAISKNIIELHGGSIWAESAGEDIIFYIKLKLS